MWGFGLWSGGLLRILSGRLFWSGRPRIQRHVGRSSHAICIGHRLVERLQIRIIVPLDQKARGLRQIRQVLFILVERINLLLMLLIELVILPKRRKLS